MQCVNCQFENMPGLTSCVRCGSSLMLATANIDVNPPRAGRLSKLSSAGRRARHKLKRSASEARAAARDGLESFNAEIRVEVPRFTATVAGWPQFYVGRRVLGWVFLLGYFGCLLPAMLFLGSDLSTWLIGAALAFHLSSIADIVLHSVQRGDPVFKEAGPMMGAACGYGYLPALLLLFVFYWPVRVEIPVSGLRAGDVVITSRFTRTRVGDAVRYSARNDVYAYRVRGTSIERVLAEGGSQVVWDGKRLTIDGKPSEWLPLGGFGRMPPNSWTVPVDSVFIPPLPQLQENPRFYIVPRANIVGRVIWRTWPADRWGPLN